MPDYTMPDCIMPDYTMPDCIMPDYPDCFCKALYWKVYLIFYIIYLL